jgi:hypothetical protein
MGWVCSGCSKATTHEAKSRGVHGKLDFVSDVQGRNGQCGACTTEGERATTDSVVGASWELNYNNLITLIRSEHASMYF